MRNLSRLTLPIVALLLTISLGMTGLKLLGQPQGYTLVYSATQAFSNAPWMSLKALYMKSEGGKLYFHFEYYGAIPSTRDHSRTIYLYLDTDKDISTGRVFSSVGRGLDYYIYFYLRGDNSSYSASVRRYNATSGSWVWIGGTGATLRPGLNYMEVWVDQEMIGYSAQGVYLYAEVYANTDSIAEQRFTYLMGTNQRTIEVDGDPADWGATPAVLTFSPKSIDPPELEPSALYIANDQENIYFRLDLRGTPSKALGAGSLSRYIYVYFDIDNNENTGYAYYSGSERYAYGTFGATTQKSTYSDLYRYAGTGEDYNWPWTGSGNAGYEQVLEMSASLSSLGISVPSSVPLLLPSTSWYVYETVPRPKNFLSYPVAEEGFSMVGLFGSEALFLGAVALLMIVEAVVVFFLARRGRRQLPPPPP